MDIYQLITKISDLPSPALIIFGFLTLLMILIILKVISDSIDIQNEYKRLELKKIKNEIYIARKEKEDNLDINKIDRLNELEMRKKEAKIERKAKAERMAVRKERNINNIIDEEIRLTQNGNLKVIDKHS